jgi:hypothetical protein
MCGARVEQNSCPAKYHTCDLYNYEAGQQLLASDGTYTGLCNAPYNGPRAERCSVAWVWYRDVFASHDHLAHNWNC